MCAAGVSGRNVQSAHSAWLSAWAAHHSGSFDRPRCRCHSHWFIQLRRGRECGHRSVPYCFRSIDGIPMHHAQLVRLLHIWKHNFTPRTAACSLDDGTLGMFLARMSSCAFGRIARVRRGVTARHFAFVVYRTVQHKRRAYMIRNPIAGTVRRRSRADRAVHYAHGVDSRPVWSAIVRFGKQSRKHVTSEKQQRRRRES
jgi:hypothetical protein